MKTKVYPSSPEGKIKAIASKSVAHRLLICAAFSDAETLIRCEETNEDIEATASCLCSLGAKISREGSFYRVIPVAPSKINKNTILECNESGSTLRFLLPVVASLGAESSFVMRGRLASRPLSPLKEELEAHGIQFSYPEANILKISGALSGNQYKIAGNISSQFISGLLFALSLLPYPTTLTVTEKIESAPYIDITLDALKLFEASISVCNNVYSIANSNGFISPVQIDVEGDWSNAAFPLALGIIGGGNITVTGLNEKSYQGDMQIVELLRKFGGNIALTSEGYMAKSSLLTATDIDASQIPDLVPILATVASVAKGQTKIYGASRLRLKESDRLESVCTVLNALGADISQTDDGLIINGRQRLRGGEVSSFGDHRIAMSAAVAACMCNSPVIIDTSEAVNKSYPAFWKDLLSLNIKCDILN